MEREPFDDPPIRKIDVEGPLMTLASASHIRLSVEFEPSDNTGWLRQERDGKLAQILVDPQWWSQNKV